MREGRIWKIVTANTIMATLGIVQTQVIISIVKMILMPKIAR